MKLVLLVAAGSLALSWILPIPLRPAELGAPAAELPDSLARLYPPEAREPVYLHRMLALASALSGIAADVLEADRDNARAGFARLAAEYVEVAELVPEWRYRFPVEPLDALEAALEGTDPNDCMEALGALGAACHACHLDTMVPVQQAHRWKSFAAITCEDVATGETLPYVKLMRDLDLAMAGIAVDVSQGQRTGARSYLGLLRARFDQLEETCLACHASRREYYVDKRARGRVDELGALLEQDPVDARRVGELLRDIGEKSCGRCHLVHVPAAMAQGLRARAGR